MIMPLAKEDILKIVEIVGREGAISGIEKSSKINMKELSELYKALDLKAVKKRSKKNIAYQIVHYVDRRIKKPIDELKKMSKDELIEYFDEVQCHQDELIELLNSIDLKSRAKSRKSIIEFAAVQINSLGIFERLSDYDGKKKATGRPLQI
jgi:hypothetical protein